MPGPMIRPSQFITTYGEGSIIESRNGPRLILPVNTGLFASSLRVRGREITVQDYEIIDTRLSKALKSQLELERPPKFVRIPSNAELGHPDRRAVYRTVAFPTWSLCTSRGKHRNDADIIYRYKGHVRKACPECPAELSANEARKEAGREAIRFMVACKNGHINDVDWKWQVCKSRDCNSEYIYWQGGGSLRNINLRCPGCNRNRKLSDIYMMPHHCTGLLR